MDSEENLKQRIDYALTLGLQYNKVKPKKGLELTPQKTVIQMDFAQEPYIVYTINMRHKIDGIDWRRERRWKNVNVKAADGFRLPFHGSLLRAASDYFHDVPMSGPEAPVAEFKLPGFKSDGLLVLHDLIYKGYATIPRNMVIDILVQLSVIDPALIEPQIPNDLPETELPIRGLPSPPPASPPPPQAIPTTHESKSLRRYKKLSTSKRRIQRLISPSNRSRLARSMQWTVTDISKPTERPVSPDPPALCNPLPDPIPNPQPIDDENEIPTIDLLTPTSTPLSSPTSSPRPKSTSSGPESSPESIESLPTTSSPEPLKSTSRSHPTSPCASPMAPSSSSPTNSSSPHLEETHQQNRPGKPTKRARMSTAKGSYLNAIRAFKQKLVDLTYKSDDSDCI